MRLCRWNVKSLCRAGSLTAAARELAGYTLDLVGVQEVRWDSKGRGLSFFVWKRKQKSSIGNRNFCAPQNCVGS